MENNYYSIAVDSTSHSPIKLKLYNSKGSLLKIISSSLQIGTNQFDIDMCALKSGVYKVCAEWNNGNGKSTTLIIKH